MNHILEKGSVGRRLLSIRTEVNKRLKIFRSLKSVDERTKKDLMGRIRHYEIQLVSIESLLRPIEKILFLLISSLGLAALVLLLFLFFFNLDTNALDEVLSENKLLSGFSVVVGSLIPAIPIFFLAIRFLRKYLVFVTVDFYSVFMKMILLWLLVNAITDISLLSKLGPLVMENRATPIQADIVVIAAAGLATTIYVAWILIVFTFVSDRIRLQKIKLYPDAAIVHVFLMLLSTLERKRMMWTDVSVKKELMVYLERIAAYMENYLPRRIHSHNGSTDAMIKNSAEQIATSIRNFAKWIFTPKQDTLEQFMSHAASCLVYTARGNWDSLERMEPEKLAYREPVWKRIKSLLRALFIAAIPILVLFLLIKFSLIKEPALTYLSIGSYVWAALSLLSHLDPSYSTKLTAIKDISQLFFPGRKKNE